MHKTQKLHCGDKPWHQSLIAEYLGDIASNERDTEHRPLGKALLQSAIELLNRAPRYIAKIDWTWLRIGRLRPMKFSTSCTKPASSQAAGLLLDKILENLRQTKEALCDDL